MGENPDSSDLRQLDLVVQHHHLHLVPRLHRERGRLCPVHVELRGPSRLDVLGVLHPVGPERPPHHVEGPGRGEALLDRGDGQCDEVDGRAQLPLCGHRDQPH